MSLAKSKSKYIRATIKWNEKESDHSNDDDNVMVFDVTLTQYNYKTIC